MEGPLAVLPSGVVTWGGMEDAETLAGCRRGRDADRDRGRDCPYSRPHFATGLEGAGIGVEVMASPQACRTYNVLLGEGRRVAIALIPV